MLHSEVGDVCVQTWSAGVMCVTGSKALGVDEGHSVCAGI